MRDPEAVRSDVASGLVTSERARNLYGVAVDTVTLEIDEEATSQLRL
jgi:N-methylhydantoinase B/oxoprolinase/acetone carboxylase alpha subunit